MNETKCVENKVCVASDESQNSEYVITEEDRARYLKEKQERIAKQISDHDSYMESLNGVGITRRKDGTYTAVLCIDPTEEMFEGPVDERFKQFYRNRKSLLDMVAANPNREDLREVLVVTADYARELGRTHTGRNDAKYRADQIYGRLTKFRVREKNGRRELHAEFKPSSLKYGITAPYPKVHTINPAMMTTRAYDTSEIKIVGLICYYLEKTLSDEELYEYYSS